MESLKSSININMYIEGILGKIYNNSIVRDKNTDEDVLNTYINLLRQFLRLAIECGFIDKNNFEVVKQKFEQISYFEMTTDETFKAHGMVNSDDNHITFKDSNMKSEFERVIFSFHEFFHALSRLSMSLDSVKGLNLKNLDLVIDDDPYEIGYEYKVRYGFGYVIDDCLAQEIAEILAYKYMGIERPLDKTSKFEAVFGNIEFESNWSNDCFYRVFQESFRNIMGNNMDEFLRDCFKGNFNDEFFKRCTTIGEKISLLLIFKNWFYMIASIYAYIAPNNCFHTVDGEMVIYSKEELEEAYMESFISSVDFNKHILSKV